MCGVAQNNSNCGLHLKSFNYITISLSLTHRVQLGVDVVHSKFGVDVVHSKASNLCESSTKYNFDCGSLIRPSYVSPGSSTYRDTRTPVRQRNETRSLSCKQEFISFTFINILYRGITSTFKLVTSICNLNTIL